MPRTGYCEARELRETRRVRIQIERLDFVPLSRISGAGSRASSEGFLDHDLADDLASILREIKASRDLGKRTASIIDLTGAPALNAKQRAIVSAWVKDTRDLMRLTSISTAFVAPSALVRGALTAIFWTQCFGGPHRVFGTLDEAVTWSLDRVRDCGVQVPGGAHEAALQTFGRAGRGERAVGS